MTANYNYILRYDAKTWQERPAGPGEVMPLGRIVRVEFSLILPAAATREEVEEWIEYGLGRGGVETGNPLLDHDLEAMSAPTLTDTGATTDKLQAIENARAEARRAHYAHSDQNER